MNVYIVEKHWLEGAVSNLGVYANKKDANRRCNNAIKGDSGVAFGNDDIVVACYKVRGIK